MNICKNCGNNTSNLKFCSSSCSAKFNNGLRKPRSEESRKKTSNSLRKLYCKIALCVDCNKYFEHKYSKLPLRCIVCNKKNRSMSMKVLSKIHHFGGNTSKIKLKYLMKDGTEVSLQSSYEIKLAKILDEYDIVWSRPSYMFWTDSLNIKHRYYADFKINDIFLDTKNDYLAIKDKEKIERVSLQNDVNVYIILEKDININYIRSLVQR